MESQNIKLDPKGNTNVVLSQGSGIMKMAFLEVSFSRGDRIDLKTLKENIKEVVLIYQIQ
jgi:hypothetical protein